MTDNDNRPLPPLELNRRLCRYLLAVRQGADETDGRLPADSAVPIGVLRDFQAEGLVAVSPGLPAFGAHPLPWDPSSVTVRVTARGRATLEANRDKWEG